MSVPGPAPGNRPDAHPQAPEAPDHELPGIIGRSACGKVWLQAERITGPDYGGLRTDHAWDGLRNDPRFEAICRRAGMGKDQWPNPATSWE